MNIPVIIRPAAELDLQDAFNRSDGIEPGLGLRLLLNVDRIVATLASQPFVFPLAYRDVRRAIVPHSPYLLFHVTLPARVVVIACFSGYRDPRWIRRSLSRRQGA